MTRIARVLDASHPAHRVPARALTGAMTEAQGRFLTRLLDDLTAVAPQAGAEARARLREQFAQGSLDKREASRAIDVLKSAIALATAPTPALVRRALPEPVKAGISSQEQALIDSRRVNAERLGLTPGRKPVATKGGSSLPRTNGILASLKAWTPEGARARLADTSEVPF